MQEVKYCVDCKHFNRHENTCFVSGNISLVTGVTTYKLAAIMREYETRDSCGRDARFFEPVAYSDDDLDDLSCIPFGVNLQGAK